jgi:hypothetical protein
MGVGCVLLGCGGKVVIDTGPGTGTGGGGSGGAATMALVTKTFDPNGPCAVNTDLNPPGADFLIVASQPISCQETLPAAFSSPMCNDAPFVWEVCVGLSPASLAVGTVALTDPSINAEEQDTGGCMQDCCESGQILNEMGSVQITAVDASSVTFTVAGASTMSPNGTIGVNGTYTAQRCP